LGLLAFCGALTSRRSSLAWAPASSFEGLDERLLNAHERLSLLADVLDLNSPIRSLDGGGALRARGDRRHV
jgi:hypothetical protein